MRTQTSLPRSNEPWSGSLGFIEFADSLLEVVVCAFGLDFTGPDRIRPAAVPCSSFPPRRLFRGEINAPKVISHRISEIRARVSEAA